VSRWPWLFRPVAGPLEASSRGIAVVWRQHAAANAATRAFGSDRVCGRYVSRKCVLTTRAVVVPAAQSSLVEFRLGDVVILRRIHPCGGNEWLIDRLGADLGLRCRKCNRHVLLDRRTVERRMTQFVERGDLAMSLAVAPVARDKASHEVER